MELTLMDVLSWIGFILVIIIKDGKLLRTIFSKSSEVVSLIDVAKSELSDEMKKLQMEKI